MKEYEIQKLSHDSDMVAQVWDLIDKINEIIEMLNRINKS